MPERGSDKFVWSDGENITDHLRRMDAYLLSVSDERKAIGKALLGLGSRIGVIDSLSEEDKKSMKNLKAALLREFCETVPCSQRLFQARTKKEGETRAAESMNFWVTPTPTPTLTHGVDSDSDSDSGIDSGLASITNS